MKRTPTAARTPMRPLPASSMQLALGGVEQVETFLDSGPSDSNRVIERHVLPGNQGR